jgi:hypothetical protein
MEAKQELTLYVPVGYQTTDFVKSCTPEESALLVNYGEKLLKHHVNLVNTEVSDVHIRELNKTLQNKEQTIDKLKSEQTAQQKSAKSDIINIQQKYLQEVDQINSKMEASQHKYQTHVKQLKNSALNEKKEITQHYKDHHLLQTSTMNSLHEKEIDTIRNRTQNDTLAERTKFRQEIEQLHNELGDLKKERTGIIEMERKRIHDEIHGSYQITIDKQTEQVRYFQTEIVDLKKSHVVVINQEKKRISDDLHQSYQLAIKQQADQINHLQTDLKQKEQGLHNLDSIMKYYQSCDNATKGAKGENRVQEIVKEYYKNCSIQDTSGTPHSGDLLLTLQNINLTCLIEVKNKKIIAETDIAKFLHDISECKNNINCALFISLITDNIPGKGNFYLEIRNNMPVIYIYLFDPSSIKFAIETLSFLNLKFSQTTTTELNHQELTSDTIELIYSEYTTLQQESIRIDNIIKNVEKQLHQLKLSKKNLNNRVEKISGYYSRHISMKPDTHEVLEVNAVADAVASVEVTAKYTEDDLEKIKKWITAEITIPKKDQIRTIINCSTTEIQKRGTRVLHNYMRDCLAFTQSKSKNPEV